MIKITKVTHKKGLVYSHNLDLHCLGCGYTGKGKDFYFIETEIDKMVSQKILICYQCIEDLKRKLREV